jgi:hypothetical protein
VPLVVFEDEERAHLLPYAPDDSLPYDVPLWRDVVVHADYHVSVQYALYSAPATTCPPGTKLEARADRTLVKLYRGGALVKVHPRQLKGGRATDPEDYPPERVAYALRAPERLVQQATALGAHVGHFAARLVGVGDEGDGGDGPRATTPSVPWAKLRQGQKLLRLGERYTAIRLDAACARALGFDLVDVRRLERILVLALEREALPVPPMEERVQSLAALAALPRGRFARPGTAFDHRFAPPTPPTPPGAAPLPSVGAVTAPPAPLETNP